MESASLTLATVVVYLALCIAIGVWTVSKSRNSRDFFMAGRNLGAFLTTLAVFASTMSGFSFIGGPGLVYSMGMSSVWIIASATCGGVVSYLLVAKRLRLLAELRDCVSLPDIVAVRYGSQAVRGWVAVAIFLGVIGYLATQVLAMGVLLQSIIGEAGWFGDINVEVGVLIASVVLLFYSVAGGMIASTYTAALQGTIMLVASALVFVAVLGTFDGGLSEAGRIIALDDPEAMGPWGTLGMFGCLSWFFIFGLGLPGQPHIVTKWMMVRRVADIRAVLPLNLTAIAVGSLLWIGVGLVMRALVLDGSVPALASADLAAPTFLQLFAHPALAALVFAALVAAIMSSADSFLNIGTAALVHDLPRALRGRGPTHELRWARITTAALVLLAALFALYTGDLVALLGAFGWGTFAAALVPVVAIGINWTRATPAAAVASIAASLAVNFGVKLAGITLPHGIDVGAVALLVSLVLFIGISLASERPTLDADVRRAMEF